MPPPELSLTPERTRPARDGGPLRRLARSFSAGPVAIPGLVVVIVITVWAATEAGQPAAHWYPGALVIAGLLVIAAATLPLRLADIPRPVLIAAGLLLAYTLWSFLSIAWAGSAGDAWEGANRTLLYLMVFVLFALWPQRSAAATTVVAAWILALSAVAAWMLIQTRSADALDLFAGGRLSEPAGYANATAALFFMPAWPALILAGRRELAPVLRGILGAAATLLAGVGLIALSRGSVFSVPIMLIAIFAVGPGRVRTFAVLLPVAAAMAVVAPAVLDANEQLPKVGSADAVSSLAPTIFIATLLVGLVVGAGAFTERRVPSARARRRAHRTFAALGLVALAVVLVVSLAIAGNPIDRVEEGWRSFKQGYPTQPGQRLSQGLGSNRYDFYRVALDVFRDNPVAGVGADNFQQEYLLARNNGQETPRYPHSVELRTLSQTGLVGALLLLGFLAAAFTAVLRTVRRGPPLAGAAAAAATAAFFYWLVHGSFDWFWEFAGLGVPAFAMLGLACGLSHRRPGAADRHDEGNAHLLPRVALLVGLVLAVLSMALPWLSDVQTKYAADHWREDPNAAYDRLERAASLDRLSAGPYLTAGTIALRRSEQARARDSFRKALERDSGSAYAALELGALASLYGNRAQAERFLRRALELDPRDSLKRDALAEFRKSGRIDVEALNSAMLRRARAIAP